MLTAARTDTGRVRPANEDSFGIDAERGLFIIADGMGGHERGEIASRLAVETVLEMLTHGLAVPPSRPQMLELLRAATMRAHQRVLHENLNAKGASAMGTTLISAAILDQTLCFAHVGDSRLYCLPGTGPITQLTRDQTLAQQLLDAGTDSARITRDDNATLLQAIGLEGFLIPATGTHEIEEGDTFIMCTDGLSDMVPSIEMASIVGHHREDCAAAAEALVTRANEAGGSDNITVVAFQL
jgi:protein phosphatase